MLQTLFLSAFSGAWNSLIPSYFFAFKQCAFGLLLLSCKAIDFL